MFIPVTYLFVSVALVCLVLHLKKIILSKMCILYCLVLLNSVLFKHLFVSIIVIIIRKCKCLDTRARLEVSKLLNFIIYVVEFLCGKLSNLLLN